MMAPAGALKGLRLLIVEDEYFIAVDTAEKLAAEGAIVVGPVATVGEALQILAEHIKLDGAVLDLNLGEEKALPVADALTARGIPFIFATSYAKGDTPARFADIPCFSKPIDVGKVARALGG
ncbi:MAG: response regulator [Brevundimonas sp.]|uniref:response regulator n=1 Tax=Brevundimonas sp. TaxID=1871086 RepID=UPI00391DE7A3